MIYYLQNGQFATVARIYLHSAQTLANAGVEEEALEEIVGLLEGIGVGDHVGNEV